ncbi:MAG: histidinol-phosphate transaminase [Chloroflexota bacterium]|nr:histidinol-phosphate transaminase [Chloroflexota bacterium]
MKHLKLNPHLLTVPLYVGGKPIEEVQEEYGLTDVVKLGSNENPLGPSPLAVAAFRDALKDAHRYPSVADKLLRQKLAAFYNAREGGSFTEQNFLTGNGLGDVLRMIADAFLFDGGEAIYCDPTFPLYPIFTKMLGAIAVSVPHDNFRYNLRSIAESITARTRVIFICNPNNPTGTVVTRDEVAALMARVPESVVVVFDESYCDFVQDADYSNSIDYVKSGHDNVLVLRGFSKIYGMANLRIGYAIGTRAMIEYLAHAQIVFNTGDPILRAAAAALDDQAHVQATRQLIAREREFVQRALAELDLNYVPSQTNFILLTDLPREVQTINEGMLRRGVIIRPMGGFGMPEAIRVTIGTREQNEKMLSAMKDVLKQ